MFGYAPNISYTCHKKISCSILTDVLDRKVLRSGAAAVPGSGVYEQPQQTENVQHKVAHKRFQEQQAQVNEVTGILKKNVDLILQRDEKLTDLDDRADALQDEASEFGKQAGKLKRKYWWKNCKMLAILIGICVVIIVIILVWAVSKEQQ